jgi:hypothetical protein
MPEFVAAEQRRLSYATRTVRSAFTDNALAKCYIGTEHILVGLWWEGEGVAAQVLVNLSADLASWRQQVIHPCRSGVRVPQRPLGEVQGASDLVHLEHSPRHVIQQEAFEPPPI